MYAPKREMTYTWYKMNKNAMTIKKNAEWKENWDKWRMVVINNSTKEWRDRTKIVPMGHILDK